MIRSGQVAPSGAGERRSGPGHRRLAQPPRLRVLGRGGGQARLTGTAGRTGEAVRLGEGGFAPAKVVYHGSAGAFAHIACRSAFPEAEAVGRTSLIGVIEAVRSGAAEAAVLPCENVLVGRVPDIHLLLPESGLAIVGEIFERIEHHLVAPPGWRLDLIRRVHSHPVALMQVRRFLATHGIAGVEAPNTAMAAALVRERADPSEAAVASELAAEVHGLTILKRNIEDDPANRTRFYVLAARPVMPAADVPEPITSLLFELRNEPGALFRAMAGFAGEGVNLTKLESYLVGGQFVATRFFCEFQGHPEQPAVRRAIEVLRCNTTRHAVLGVFAMHAQGAGLRIAAAEHAPDSRKGI